MRYDYGTLAAKTRLSFPYVFVVSYLYEIALITSFLRSRSILHCTLSLTLSLFLAPISSIRPTKEPEQIKWLFIMTRHEMHCKISSFSKFSSLSLLTHDDELNGIHTTKLSQHPAGFGVMCSAPGISANKFHKCVNMK